MRWIETDKGDPRCRALADLHYTRKSVGHPMWTRPGWNYVLYAEQKNGRSAVYNWWRPKWESGLAGTQRQDGLRAIECTIFRNQSRFLSSKLIVEAIACLMSWSHANDVEWPDGIITGVNSAKTASGRSAEHDAGYCFREAGFVEFAHPGKGTRADIWLRYAGGPINTWWPKQSDRLIARRPKNPEASQLCWT